jgi:tetratricopeptide (TPR) repeat protein
MNTPDAEHDPELMAYLALDGRPGPAQRISKERALAMVDAVLADVPPMAARSQVKRRGQAGRALWVSGAVLLGVVSGAAAARWYFAERTPAPQSAPQSKSPALAAPSRVEAPFVPVRGSEPSDLTTAERERGVPDDHAAHAAAPAAAAAIDPHEAAPVAERAAPEDLLQKANRLRTHGRFRQSAQTYQAVSERYPGTLSAYVAQVAAASIELEHLSRPLRARKLFERALREHPEGALDVEARQGLATALRDLGDTRAEATVLRSLLELHAGSPAARRAQVRLKELGSDAQ